MHTRSCVILIFLVVNILPGTNQLLHYVIAVEFGCIMNRGKPLRIPLVQLVNLTPSKEVVDVSIHHIDTVVTGSLQQKLKKMCVNRREGKLGSEQIAK